jgi:hypothetical protein
VSSPVARPIASREAHEKPKPGGGLSAIRTANDSPLGHPLRLSATRLETISARLVEGDWQVLNFVSECRLASGKQLVRRFWLTSDREAAAARAGRRKLKQLADWRVLDPLPTRAIGGLHGGSDTIIYGVGVAGVKLLVRRGLAQKRLGTPGERYIRHTLACTELLVRLSEAADRGELDVISAEGEPACWRGFIGAGGARLMLKPDLFLRVGVGALEDRWMIEVDLSTEASGTLQAKLKHYLAHYRSGSEQREHGVYPRVLWAVPDARRAAQLADVLERLPAEARRLFAVCLLDKTVAFLAMEARA